MPNVNLINPAVVGAAPESVRYASTMGILNDPKSALSVARGTGNWTPLVIPAGAVPAEIERLKAINRQGTAAASSYKPPKPTTQYRLPSGQMDEPDVAGALDENEAGHSKKKKVTMKSKPVTNPSNLGYSQSYDPQGRGYRPLGTVSPMNAAALRAKFGTPSNL